MKNTRRSFMRMAGVASVGSLVLPQIACKSEGAAAAKKGVDTAKAVIDVAKPSLDAFGIQLYTLRDVIPSDPQGTLKKVADMGFNQIEGYDGDQGMFWNMGNKAFKTYISDLGLDMVSSHCNIRENFEEKAGQAAEIGMKYLICPYIGPQKSMDDWKRVTDRFNECGAICKKEGIRFAYHNHAYSFKAFSGQIPHDFIMENTDPVSYTHLTLPTICSV